MAKTRMKMKTTIKKLSIAFSTTGLQKTPSFQRGARACQAATKATFLNYAFQSGMTQQENSL